MHHVEKHNRVGLMARVLGLFALAATLLLGSVEGEAKLDPYFFLRNRNFSKITPRILFVVDASGSMTWKISPYEYIYCAWANCEGTDPATMSRMQAARRAINSVVQQTSELASFALMTFDMMPPPTTAPLRCSSQQYRFFWVNYYQNLGMYGWEALQPLPNQFGSTGQWDLCEVDFNVPYTYLRWDNLGFTHPSIKQTTAKTDATIPPGPLFSPGGPGTAAQFTNSGPTSPMRWRKVQWFGNFMGPRFHVDCSKNELDSLAKRSVGDYAYPSGICGHDFYYWPYVDDYPGYSRDAKYGVNYNCLTIPCTSYTTFGIYMYAGTHDRDWVTSAYASLLSPFYFKQAVDTWAGNADPALALRAGPLTKDDATSRIHWMSSPMLYGGIDMDHDTPWSYTIGSIPATVPDSNAPYSHPTVASYLKYITTTGSTDSCVPTYAVVISDGVPSPGYGGTTLYNALRGLRQTLGVKTYVVGFGVSGTEISSMACGAAGALNGNCYEAKGPSNNNWDTCKNPNDPPSATNGCAWIAADATSLADALVTIVEGALDINVPSGPGMSLNTPKVGGGDDLAQTKVTAYTEYPSWKGHVRQELCEDEDPTDENGDHIPDHPGTLAPWCRTLPFSADEATHATFGPCSRNTGMSPTFGNASSLRVWDAGECLAQTAWTNRRIYSHDANNQVYRITDPTDPTKASTKFKSELEVAIGTTLTVAQADYVARFILGESWPEGWKLPGLALSAPIVTRRIPKPAPAFVPSVGIRDPHCAGRVMANPGEVPKSLVDFANDAWQTRSDAYGTYYEYQEAVLIGDDLGVVHAFQLATGNELFGLIPRFALKSAYEQAQIGAAAGGQPADLAKHKYGVSATVNQGWVFDDRGTPGNTADDTWRHLVLLGMGAGGTELIALDVSHMGRLAANQPVDVLWTTKDAALQTHYGPYLGQTWARPALTYRFEPDPMNDVLSLPPKAFVVMGSGYQTIVPPNPANQQGRRLWLANALTGAVEQHAVMPAIDPAQAWDSNFGSLTDIAVGTHCISRYWAEMQEAYIADPYGRLYRWDLFYPPGDPKEGESDSVQTWKDSGMWARQVVEFGSCMGAGSTCSVAASPRDPFFFGPAAVANNRVEDPSGADEWDSNQSDQFMIGLVSGNMNDDATNAPGSNFHSSLYLLVDDHRTNKHGGFAIPAGNPKRLPGTDANYMRMAISDVTRTRTVRFPNGTSETTTAKFRSGTRPLRAPRMNVYAVADQSGEILEDIEVIVISFYFYEPADQSCDPRWKDPVTGKWTFDSGSSYEVAFRVTVDGDQGFNLVSGSGKSYFDSVTFGSTGGAGLIGPVVTQIDTPECESGACGPKIPLAPNLPCDPNEGAAAKTGRITVPVAWSEITGFTPIE